MKKWVNQWLKPASRENATEEVGFPWVALEHPDQLEAFGPETGREGLQLIFKHSTRCGLSSMMLRRFEAAWLQDATKADFYLLDLVRFRGVSDAVAQRFHLRHQSPQVLIIRGGRLEATASHGDITGLRLSDFQK